LWSNATTNMTRRRALVLVITLLKHNPVAPDMEYTSHYYEQQRFFVPTWERVDANVSSCEEYERVHDDDQPLDLGTDQVLAVKGAHCLVYWAPVRARKARRVADRGATGRVPIKESRQRETHHTGCKRPVAAYDAATVSSRSTKGKANDLFAAAVQDNAPLRGLVVYLDAQDAHSTGVFKQCGLDKTHQLVVVNLDPVVVGDMLTSGKVANVLLYTGYVAQYIQQLRGTPAGVAAMWFDYCCTLHGNPTMSPLRDLYEAVDAAIFQPGAVIGITLCTRDKNQRSTRTQEQVRLVLAGGYPHVQLLERYTYIGMMLLVFQV